MLERVADQVAYCIRIALDDYISLVSGMCNCNGALALVPDSDSGWDLTNSLISF